jgi:hypothetical protein
LVDVDRNEIGPGAVHNREFKEGIETTVKDALMTHWIYTLLGEKDLVRVKVGVENHFFIWLSRGGELLAIWAVDGCKATATL